ncbi:MAG TPA: single-stranded DNA-binding protein [Kribbella sp.]
MAWNETVVTVVGIVVTEVTRRDLASGISRAEFRVLSVARKYNVDQGAVVDGDKLFLNVQCWRKLADGVATTLAKGDAVIVTGKLRNREYDLNGERRHVAEIEATAIGPNLMWATVEVLRPRPAARQGELALVPEIVAPRLPEQVGPKQEEPVRDVVEAPF